MTKIVFSSDQLPTHLSDYERFRLWADMYGAQIVEVDAVPLSDARFFASSEILPIGSMAVVQTDVAVERFERNHQHLVKDVRDDCLIGLCLNDARIHISQRGRDMVIGKGHSYLVLTAEPIQTKHDMPMVVRGLSIPRQILRERIGSFNGEPEQLVLSPVLDHFHRYLAMLMETPAPMGSALQQHVESTIIDLLVLALGARGESAELANMRGLRAARLWDIACEIERNFDNCAFTTESVAKKVGLSRRYINEILYETGTTFSERVLELRLQKARSMLSDARHDTTKVSEIAFVCGFNEVSYFNRRFRARFGCSPTQYRSGSA